MNNLFDWKFYTPKKLTLQLITSNVCISSNKFTFLVMDFPQPKIVFAFILNIFFGGVSCCNLGDPQ